jgi:hypothetical protein
MVSSLRNVFHISLTCCWYTFYREVTSSLPLLVFSKDILETRRLTAMLRGLPYLGQYCSIVSPRLKDGGQDSLILETDDTFIPYDATAEIRNRVSRPFSSSDDQPGWKTFHLVTANLQVENYRVVEGCGHKECGGSHLLDQGGKNKEQHLRCFAPLNKDNIAKLVIKADLVIEGL